MGSVANMSQYIMGALMSMTAFGTTTATILEQPKVSPSQGDLLDLLNLDLSLPVNVLQVSSIQMGAADLPGGGLDGPARRSFIPSSGPVTFAPPPAPTGVSTGLNDVSALSMGQAWDLLDGWCLRLSGCLQ